MSETTDRPNPLITLGEQAYNQMHQMILVGELSAGEWVRKRRIAAKLNMSPTPVVEAMRRLEHEGLMHTERMWGTRVRVLTVPELFELSGMRIVLEGFVARCAADRLSDDQIVALRLNAQQIDDVDLKYVSDPSEGEKLIAAADVDFHLGLVRETRLPLVLRELQQLRALQAICRMWVTPGKPTSVTHLDIVNAIASRDGPRAEATIRKHIQDSVDSFIPGLRARFGDGPILFEPSGETDGSISMDTNQDSRCD